MNHFLSRPREIKDSSQPFSCPYDQCSKIQQILFIVSVTELANTEEEMPLSNTHTRTRVNTHTHARTQELAIKSMLGKCLATQVDLAIDY